MFSGEFGQSQTKKEKKGYIQLLKQNAAGLKLKRRYSMSTTGKAIGDVEAKRIKQTVWNPRQ